ncbi:MAG TPA: glycosyltransferase family 4 protein [Thermosipho africanus]|jgi:glycosyltransferase involved in cell wall biosynthesis|nr:teichuronic acid biosynthesis glycosyltransferase TuaC [Thermosipho sp. (in: thermotogales)]HCF37574.1 glycosyltransferase family 4 protein [Thermosipho africanus]
MKILFLTNFYPKVDNKNSGIFVVKRLFEYKNLGIDFDVIPIYMKDDVILSLARKILKLSSTEAIEEFYNINFKIVNVKINLFKKILEKIGVVNFSKEFFKYLEKELDLNSYDIVYAHGMSLNIPAGFIAKIIFEKYKIPYIVTLHGGDVNYNMAKFGKKNLYIQTFEKASKVVFVSDALLERAKSYGYSGRNAAVIPNGYDPTIFKPMDKVFIRKELNIYKEGYKYVGFVGNLIPVKRADKLPEIFEKIAKRYKRVKFLIVGDGYLREKIEEKMKQKNLNYIFTERVLQEDVARYMNAMDVMVLPSRNEGWPCVVLEAQACGTCVIGSSNGGIPEAIGFEEYVVKDGENFEERFAKKVVEILSNGYESDKFIQRVKNYTWENIVKKEISVLENFRKDE